MLGNQPRNLPHSEEAGQSAAPLQQEGRANIESAIQSSEYVFKIKSLNISPPSASFLGTCLESVVAQQSVLESESMNLLKICPLNSSFPENLAFLSQSLLRIPHPWALSQQKQHCLKSGKIKYLLFSRTSWVHGVVAVVIEEQKASNFPLFLSSLDMTLSESNHSLPASLYGVVLQLSTKSCWKRAGHTGGACDKAETKNNVNNRILFINIYKVDILIRFFWKIIVKIQTLQKY